MAVGSRALYDQGDRSGSRSASFSCVRGSVVERWSDHRPGPGLPRAVAVRQRRCLSAEFRGTWRRPRRVPADWARSRRRRGHCFRSRCPGSERWLCPDVSPGRGFSWIAHPRAAAAGARPTEELVLGIRQHRQFIGGKRTPNSNPSTTARRRLATVADMVSSRPCWKRSGRGDDRTVPGELFRVRGEPG